MTKKKRDESRATFIPSEVEETPTRGFIPEAPPPPPPTVVEMQSPTVGIGETGGVILKMTRTGEREIEISLTIPPLEPCVEKLFLPLKVSRERLASITAGAIKRAAGSAETDGVIQHSRKEQEEAESKARYARR